MRLGVRTGLLGVVLAASLVLGGCFLLQNQVPVASYSASPTEGGTPLYVAFDASASYDPDGYVSSYAWSFGDGGTGSGRTAAHTYSAAGTYSVTLTVRDDSGDTDTAGGHVTAHEAATYAVIVGIADYSTASELPALQFTDDDAQSVYSWLRNAGGWSSANVRLLLNSQATVANLVAALDAFDDASPYDTLLFFYSGHGTWAFDDDAFEESDGRDECLCLYDQTYFRDDTLEALLAQVPMTRIAVFLDACYSGGQLNSLSAQDDAGAWDVLSDLERLADARTRDLDQLAKSVVAVSACRYDEYSYELNSLEHGAFTYALLEGLGGPADAQGNGDGVTSVEECYAYVAERVPDILWPEGVIQWPQLLDLCSGELGFANVP